MNTVKVSRHHLLEKLKKNRDGHRELFLRAQEGYKEAVINALSNALHEARTGKAYRTYVSLVAPEDHTSDYDTVIQMLEMSIDGEITIERHEFSCFVLDQWTWAAHANFLNTTYATGGTVSPEADVGRVGKARF